MTDTTAAARYRKLPVEIEAIRFDGTPQSIVAVMHFVDAGRTEKEIRVHAETDPAKSWIGIPTLGGTMRADAGDWIVRGVKGELCPCKPDVFAVTYERADVSSAVVAPPTDQAALRDRIAEALLDHLSRTADIRTSSSGGELAFMPEVTDAERMRMADAVLAVLPAPADRAAVLRDFLWRLEQSAGDAAAEKFLDDNPELRRMADETATTEVVPCMRPEPHPAHSHSGLRKGTAVHGRCPGVPAAGARHVHITIRHPDPTTATTAAHAIADLIHGEYSDSLRLTITTDAPGAGAAPSRPADETPDTTTQPDLQVWPLRRILTEVRCGSADWSWDEEWADLDRRHAETGYLDTLEAQIRERGITMPVLIGSDGRLWDGHHRLRIAVRAGIEYVPVEIVPPAAGARQDGEQP